MYRNSTIKCTEVVPPKIMYQSSYRMYRSRHVPKLYTPMYWKRHVPKTP